MLQFTFITFSILFCIFCGIMIYDSRTLWTGFSFFIMMLNLGVVLLLIFLEYSQALGKNEFLVGILWILLGIVFVCVLLFPAILLIMFFIEGLKVIKHEGLKPANLLSILFSILLFAYLCVWPMLGNLSKNIVGVAIYVLISFSVVYILSLMAMYSLSAILNLIHLKKSRKLDYIVVLGSGIKGTKITPLLAGRIERGIDLLKCNSNAMLIMSGGQGRGEDIPEGEAMAAYAIEKGVDAERIIIERKSVSTEENLKFSRELMSGERPRIAIVTTSYHVFRALILARKQGIKCVGFGSKTKWYFTLNAIIREFIGYLSLTRKKHISLIAFMAGLMIIFIGVNL